jgi:Uma2 family endonuclease
MTEGRPLRATEENWMFPPAEGWTFDQVKDLDLPFDWELVDGGLMVRGQTKLWHDRVRGRLVRLIEDAAPKRLEVIAERCVMLDDENVVKPDIVVHDPSGLDPFEAECTPAERVVLAVEVVSPGSIPEDRIRKPAKYARAGIPYYWHVELRHDRSLEVYEHWLNPTSRSYAPAPIHPLHRGRLSTEEPFPLEFDLGALVG